MADKNGKPPVRAGDPLSYDALVQSWPEITRLARTTSDSHVVWFQDKGTLRKLR